MGQVYKITNKANNKAYIGASTYPFDKRYPARWLTDTHNHELQNDAFFYGVGGFTIEILKENIPDEDLAEAEADYIKVHDTLTPKGYNIKRIGKFVAKEDPKTKKAKIKKLKREKFRRDFYQVLDKGPIKIADAIIGFRKMLNKKQVDFAKLQNTSLAALRAIEQDQDKDFQVGTVNKLLRGSGLELVVGLSRKIEPLNLNIEISKSKKDQT